MPMTNISDNFSERLVKRLSGGEIFNLPNCITITRIGVIPILFVLLAAPGPTVSLILALIFIVANLTDVLDGYIARRYQIETTVGKFLDPIADKLVVSTALILLIPLDRAPAWIVALMVIRDVAVDGMRSVASSQSVVIAASKLGKRKTLCQIFAVSALIIHYPFFGINAHLVGTVILYLALLLSIHSGIDYFVKFYREVIKKPGNGKNGPPAPPHPRTPA
jgi:CDP-diacylglycerol--glycerol-3-phosphate 3-phosphatidyltransferase